MRLAKRVIGTVGYLGGLPATLEAFTWAWGQLIQYNTEYLVNPALGEIVHYAKATVSLHWFARNSLVEQMQGDWLVMLDTDHAPPPDLIARMLHYANEYGLDVATALYRHKNVTGSPVIYQWDPTGKWAVPIGNWDQDVSAFEIGSAGGGALFVRRHVFEQIEAELGQKPFDPLEHYGEDHGFFQRLRRVGIKAHALTRVESPHLQVTPLLMEDYDLSSPSIAGPRVAVNGF